MKSTPEVESLLDSWMRDLRGRGKSPATLDAYASAVRSLTDWAIDHDRHTNPVDQDRGDIQDFMAHTLAHLSSGTAGTRYRNLKQWFKWLLSEDEIDADPMEKMHHPTIEEKMPEVITEPDLRALLDVTAGRSFIDRRDRAIIRVMIDTGIRRGELAALTINDVDLDGQLLLVSRSKTKRGRLVPIGHKATAELDKYIRVRKTHKAASSPMLWLGQSGPISGDLVRKILAKRCDEAGIARIHPHRFRHTFAHRWQMAAGSEQDLARIAGWTPGSVMLARYGASAAAERARETHRRIGPGDSL
jgi:site-specific recombinase XerD